MDFICLSSSFLQKCVLFGFQFLFLNLYLDIIPYSSGEVTFIEVLGYNSITMTKLSNIPGT